MSANFEVFRHAVAQQFARMQQHELFVVDIAPDVVYSHYQISFPDGSNNIYRERPLHDCATCRSFIRTVGNVVAIIDGKMATIWDVLDALPQEQAVYRQVTSSMSKFVKAAKIKNAFLTYQSRVGQDKTFEQLLNDEKKPTGEVMTWTHFFADIDKRFVKPDDKILNLLGKRRDLTGLFLRGLRELSVDSLKTVRDLIAQKSIYRGEEKKHIIEGFLVEKLAFDQVPEADQVNYVWLRTVEVPFEIARTKNDVIGGLLENLTNGKDLEEAVTMYEAQVAPSNYKRTTAIVTPAMVQRAQKTVEELGLTSALERRYANLTDITVNNILFANRDARKAMGGSALEDLLGEVAAKAPKSLDRIEEIGIEDFLKNVLPRVDSIEVLLENRHAANFVSLVAPVNPTAGNLFKWDNNFSWSYAGEVADSIKERVKRAGGSVDGDLCCRLAWDYSDDLDLHMFEPDGGHVYFGNRRNDSECGGQLDVDANGMDGQVPEPVENIVYASKAQMKSGDYELVVHNYSRNQTAKQGFEVEIEFAGTKLSFPYDKALRTQERITIAVINYDRKTGEFTVNGKITGSQTSKQVWGLPTQSFHKVNVLMMSPNHWDGQGVGNRHYFFMLEGARAEQPARGFYNEFLKNELTEHRKVFEMLGGRMKAQDTPDQLSGLGFSSTQKNNVVLRVQGSFQRTLKVVF